MTTDGPALTGTTLTIVVIAIAVQVLLAVIALVVLVRSPRDRVAFGVKWPWVLIVLLINLIGPVLFFAVGRRPAPVTEPVGTDPVDPRGVVSSLYGEDGR